jgi:hypothetical protein
MPMKKSWGGWKPVGLGWGLVDARTGKEVVPPELISDEPIEMSDWELLDFAVQVVRQKLEEEGRKIMSWQSNPSVDPSIWFVGEQGPEWVVVRAARYPSKSAPVPSNIEAIAQRCSRLSSGGNFAAVAFANADDPFDPLAEKNGNFLPLLRGHRMHVRYDGMVPLRTR